MKKSGRSDTRLKSCGPFLTILCKLCLQKHSLKQNAQIKIHRRRKYTNQKCRNFLSSTVVFNPNKFSFAPHVHRWLSCTYMAWAQLGAVFPRAGSVEGWAWAGVGDAPAAVGLEMFVRVGGRFLGLVCEFLFFFLIL
jgi:hypothetical protein